MKVLLVNGSPNRNGCTYTALSEIANVLQEENIETHIFHIGNKMVRGCIACHKCNTLEKCIFDDDVANELQEQMSQANGIVIGSPVYFAGPNGALCALLDRIFFSGGHKLAYKPACAIVSARRSGTTAAFERLNKYFSINNMPIITSQYWNAVHGATPEDVIQDLEGLQTMRTLGRNMAWMLKNINNSSIEKPETEQRLYTNFIR